MMKGIYKCPMAAAVFLIAGMSFHSVVHSQNQAVSEAFGPFPDAFGPWPQSSPADAGNELSGIPWAELLGQKLFNEKALSANGQESCASCHDEHLAFTDGRVVAIGAGKHFRNTQGLLDVGLQRWFGWDGGTDSLWAASLRPMFNELELDNDVSTIAHRLRRLPDITEPFYRAEIDISDNETFVVLISKAIAAYLRTLRSNRTPFDYYRDAVLAGNASATSYPEDARRGLALFFTIGNCHVCHFGPNFSNQEFHDTGRPFFTDVGQVDPGRYTGIQRVRNDRYNLLGQFNGTDIAAEILKTDTVKLGQVNFGQWRTPSLRNLLKTAPYMHDGSLKTLRDVVDAYADINPDRLHSNGEAILKPLSLSDQQREDIVAFLKSLSEGSP